MDSNLASLNTFALSSFKNRECIGRGGFGEVYKADHETLGLVALKTPISNGALPRRDEDILRKEACHLHALQHPCIVKLLALIMEQNNYSLVLEFIHFQSVTEFLADYKGAVQMPIKIKFLRDVAHAMEYLHSRTPAALHLDLKADNILINERIKAKVSDFGLCEMKRKSKTLTNCLPVKKCTVSHTTPEIWENINTRSHPAQDVYAFAITAWEICTEDKPYGERSNGEIRQAVQCGQRPDLTKLSSLPPQFKALKDIIEACWHQKTSQRPTFTGIKQDIETQFNAITVEIYSEAVDECFRNRSEKLIEISKDNIMEEFKACKDIISGFSSEQSTEEYTGASSLLPHSNVIPDVEYSLQHPVQRETETIEYSADKDLIRPNFLDERQREQMYLEGRQRYNRNSGNIANSSNESITFDLHFQRRQLAGRELNRVEQGRTDENMITPSTNSNDQNLNLRPSATEKKIVPPVVGNMVVSAPLNTAEPLSNIGAPRHSSTEQKLVPTVVDMIIAASASLDDTEPLSSITDEHYSGASSNVSAAQSSAQAMAITSQPASMLSNNKKNVSNTLPELQETRSNIAANLNTPRNVKTKGSSNNPSSSNDASASEVQAHQLLIDRLNSQTLIDTSVPRGESSVFQNDVSGSSSSPNLNICDAQSNQTAPKEGGFHREVKSELQLSTALSRSEKLDTGSFKRDTHFPQQHVTNRPMIVPIDDAKAGLIATPKKVPQTSSQQQYRTGKADTKVNADATNKPTELQAAQHLDRLNSAPVIDAIPSYPRDNPEQRRPATPEQVKTTENLPVGTLKHNHSGGGFTEIRNIPLCGIQSLSIGDRNIINFGSLTTTSPENSSLTYSNPFEPLTDSKRTLNSEDKEFITKNIGKEWKEFARKLGLTDVEIDAIDHDYDKDGLNEKVHHVIVKWEGKFGAEANIKSLASAFYELGRKDLAVHFK